MLFPMTHLSLTAAAILLPICVQAVAFTDDTFDGIAVGQSKELTWSGDDSPVTIKLMQGDPKALEPVVTVASGVAGGSYTWVPKTLMSGTYCLSITQGTETNYSPQFSLTGPSPPGAPVNKAASAHNAGPSVAPSKAGSPIVASKASGPKALLHPLLPSAVLAAYHGPSEGCHGGRFYPYPPREGCYGSRINRTGPVYGFDDSTTSSYSYAEIMDSDVGRYANSGAAGVGMNGVVCGLAVMVGWGAAFL